MCRRGKGLGFTGRSCLRIEGAGRGGGDFYLLRVVSCFNNFASN